MLSVDSITSPHHCLNLKGCKLVAFHSLKSFFASLTKNPMVFICVPCVPSTIPAVHHPALPEHSNIINNYKAYNGKFTLYFRPPSSRSKQKSLDSGKLFDFFMRIQLYQLIKVRSNLNVKPMQMSIDQLGNLQNPS